MLLVNVQPSLISAGASYITFKLSSDVMLILSCIRVLFRSYTEAADIGTINALLNTCAYRLSLASHVSGFGAKNEANVTLFLLNEKL